MLQDVFFSHFLESLPNSVKQGHGYPAMLDVRDL